MVRVTFLFLYFLDVFLFVDLLFLCYFIGIFAVFFLFCLFLYLFLCMERLVLSSVISSESKLNLNLRVMFCNNWFYGFLLPILSPVSLFMHLLYNV